MVLRDITDVRKITTMEANVTVELQFDDNGELIDPEKYITAQEVYDFFVDKNTTPDMPIGDEYSDGINTDNEIN